MNKQEVIAALKEIGKSHWHNKTGTALDEAIRLLEGDGWMGIENAPRELTPILVGYWDTENFAENEWCQFTACFQRVDFDEAEGEQPNLGWMPLGCGGDGEAYQIFPTHWQPLPTPPKEK